MSALWCGCDEQAGWTCKMHKEIADVVARFKDRLMQEEQKKQAQSWIGAMRENEARLQLAADVYEDRRTVRRCADVLAAFYRAPLSMSSVQPLLTLAEELNPSLKKEI